MDDLTLRQKIEKYPNHHLLGGSDTSGGMEQNYDELEWLCQFIIDRKIHSFLEIGTANGVFHKFLKNEMKLDIESISPVKVDGIKMHVGKSQDPDILKQCRHFYDMVFVDGDHSAQAVRADYENFKGKCRYMAFHDVAGKNDCEDVKAFWDIVSKWHESWVIYGQEGVHSGIGIIKMR